MRARKPVVMASAGAMLAAMLLLPASGAQAGAYTGVANGNFTSNTAEVTTTVNGVTYNNVGGQVFGGNLSGWSLTGCAANCNSSVPAADSWSWIANTANVGTAGLVYNNPLNNAGNPQVWQAPGGTAPSAAAFVSDGGFETGVLYQTVSNLSVGDTYLLQFSQATMQQTVASLPFSAAWNVYFGTGSASNAVVTYGNANGTVMNNPSQGSTPWTTDTLSFTASATSETLAFFATASNGQPPFLLLDGVSLTDVSPAPQASVPEPASLALLSAGLLGLVAWRRKRPA